LQAGRQGVSQSGVCRETCAGVAGGGRNCTGWQVGVPGVQAGRNRQPGRGSALQVQCRGPWCERCGGRQAGGVEVQAGNVWQERGWQVQVGAGGRQVGGVGCRQVAGPCVVEPAEQGRQVLVEAVM